MDFAKWASEHLVIKTITGSRLYGTYRPDSDYDYRGVCLDPPEALLGIVRFDQQEHVTKGHDEVIYGMSKFLNMALGANPSILDILFAPSHMIERQDEIWAEVSSNATAFLSQKVRYTFTGYAYSQLKRIKRHKVWIDNPPDRPELEDYGLRLHSSKKGGQSIRLKRTFKHRDESSVVAQYKEALREYKKYQEWRTNRNPERAVLEELYGYDVKHAAHLVRLLLQGESILLHGEYMPILYGKTREIVHDVLHGKWDYDKLVTFAEKQEAVVREMPTRLPKTPDRSVANRLLKMFASISLSTDKEFASFMEGALWQR